MSAVANDNVELPLPAEVDTNRAVSRWMLPLEGARRAADAGRSSCCCWAAWCRAMSSRSPIIWIDELVSHRRSSGLAMLGAAHRAASQRAPAADAVRRRLPAGTRDFVHAFALVAGGGLPGRAGRTRPSSYAQEEWFITHAGAGHPEHLPRRGARLRRRGDAGDRAASTPARTVREAGTWSAPPCWWRRWPRCAGWLSPQLRAAGHAQHR